MEEMNNKNHIPIDLTESTNIKPSDNEELKISHRSTITTAEKHDCPSCNSDSKTTPISYVYAIGNIIHRFCDKSLEMEVAQVIVRKLEGETKSLTSSELIYQVLTDPDNRYIAREVRYVLNIQGIDTYILIPTDPYDIDKLAQAVRPVPAPGNMDVIIGRRGPIAPPQMCNGLMVPIVFIDQIYSFDRDTLIKSIPKRKGVNEEQFNKTAGAIFDHIFQIVDNTGATDIHRALN